MCGRKSNQDKIKKGEKIKMKRKNKTILFSTMLICLFILSFSLTTQAADPPVMTVTHDNFIEISDLPIKINVNFQWDTGINAQALYAVHVDWDIDKTIVAGLYRVSYAYTVGNEPRPILIVLTLPTTGMVENSTIYFKVSYSWKPYFSSLVEETPSNIYSIDIRYEGYTEVKEKQDLYLYIGLGSAGAVLLIVLALIYTRRRR